MFSVLDIGASGLTVQRVRMDATAQNVLNLSTVRATRGPDGSWEPYRRRIVNIQTGQLGAPEKPGVHVASIELDRSPFQIRHEPGHPDADSDGNVRYPNVNMAYEFINMIEASRAYEANVTMMETTKAMLNSTMRLLA